MKKLAILVLTMVVFSTTNAQQLIATLNHNDTISVYYGPSAFQQAYNAAVNGDIITLSPGTFNALTIEKIITIRGAGMYPDSTAGTEATIITGDYYLDIASSEDYQLIIEGIYFSGSMIYKDATLPLFYKCYFYNVSPWPSTNYITRPRTTLFGASFINCVVNSFSDTYSSSYNGYYHEAHNTQFINSIINSMGNGHSPSLTNCVALIFPNNSVSITNSIVYFNSIANGVNALASFNSIGVYTGTGDTTYFHYDNLGDHNLSNYNSFDSVFSTFRGTYDQGVDFHLLESIANTHRGTDGTEIGIYGGQYPFDPRVSIPTLRINAARRSNDNGNLEVDVEVVED